VIINRADAKELARLVKAWSDAAYRDDDGNDGEHDAGFALASHVAGLIGVEVDTSYEDD
jgi:hypothetical protein